MSHKAIQSVVPQTTARAAFELAARIHDAAGAPEGAARQISANRGSGANGANSNVQSAIASAAQQTTIDFDFLVAQAQVESAMDPNAKARTSSATGLYQFIESTWLGTMQRHGERFGLGDVAAQISMSASGTAYVADPATRQEILALRRDPQIAALMAAGLAEDNRAHLAPILGRQPDHSELYLAHFLGAGGAGRFLSAMAQDPNQNAAELFRRPAAANRPVFYERNGQPRSLEGVMNYLSGKLERARDYADLAPPQLATPSSFTTASLAPPGATNLTATRPPYMIADEAVFGPLNPPIVTGRNRPTIEAASPLSLRAPGRERSMSGVLETTFGAGSTGDVSGQSSNQVQRAYGQLKALGL